MRNGWWQRWGGAQRGGRLSPERWGGDLTDRWRAWTLGWGLRYLSQRGAERRRISETSDRVQGRCWRRSWGLGTSGSDECSDWKRTSGSYRKQLSTDGEGERPGVWGYCWEEKTVTVNYLHLNRLCQISSRVWFEKCSPYNVKCDFCACLYEQQDQFSCTVAQAVDLWLSSAVVRKWTRGQRWRRRQTWFSEEREN